MSAAKKPAHTPGPWRRAEGYRPSTNDVGTPAFAPYILCADGRNVAAAMIGGFDDMLETSANADLIAAAPDMLEALRDLREAATEAYKAGRIDAEVFVRAGNVIAEAGHGD